MAFQDLPRQHPSENRQSPAEFRKLATDKGFAERGKLRANLKAGAVVAWLKADFGLGCGHAMAIVALLKGKKGDSTP